MVQVIQPETNTSRALQGFGQAANQQLSQQLPKEIERIRLSQGLKDIGQNAQTNQTPYDQFSQFLSIPGMTPEKAQMLFPYLQAEAAKREQLNRGNVSEGQSANALPGRNVPTTQQTTPLANSANNQLPEEAPSSIVTPEQTRAKQIIFNPPSQEDVKREAAELATNERATYPTLQAAEDEINRRYAVKKAQIEAGHQEYDTAKGIQDEVDKSFGNALGDLQATGVAGEILDKLKRRAYDKVNSGQYTPTQAGTIEGKKALQLSKDLEKVRKIGSLGLGGADAVSAIKQTKSLAEPFVEDGFGELYADEVQSSLGVSPAVAHELTYPVSKDKEINNIIANLPEEGIEDVFGFGKISTTKGKKLRNITREISQNLNENTSLLATAQALENKGYSGRKFLDQIENDYKENRLGLYEHQIEELKKPHGMTTTLGDAWLMSLGQVKPLKYMRK